MSDKRTWQITIEVEATRTQAQALFGEIADWAHGEPYRLPDITDWSPAVSLGPVDDLGVAAAEQAAKDYITRLAESGEPFVKARYAVRVPSWMVGAERSRTEALVCVSYADEATGIGSAGRLWALATDHDLPVEPLPHLNERNMHGSDIWTEWAPGDDE